MKYSTTTSNAFKKEILYNYLYLFSEVEVKLKAKFKEVLSETVSEEIQNKFRFLHLPNRIQMAFEGDFRNDQFKINRLKVSLNDEFKVSWSLKQCLMFADQNNFLDQIVDTNIPFKGKPHNDLKVIDLLSQAISIRNCLAHETFNIRLRGSFEVLSNDQLEQAIKDDTEFESPASINSLEDHYKYALTYYFYLKELENKID